MPDGLYDQDALLWSEQQADLLRRLAAGERVNDAVDWSNVIEEIEAMGRSELRSCGSLLRQALIHLLKLTKWPDSRSHSHWRSEVLAFLGDALDAFSPSMRQRISVSALYEEANGRLRETTDESGAARPVPAACPFDLDDLLVRRPNVDAYLARLQQAGFEGA